MPGMQKRAAAPASSPFGLTPTTNPSASLHSPDVFARGIESAPVVAQDAAPQFSVISTYSDHSRDGPRPASSLHPYILQRVQHLFQADPRASKLPHNPPRPRLPQHAATLHPRSP